MCLRYDLILINQSLINSSSISQVFVANPNKPKPILEILLRNQDKLVEFLTRFHTERSEDEQFNDEKAYLIKQIKELKPITDGTTSSQQQWSNDEF